MKVSNQPRLPSTGCRVTLTAPGCSCTDTDVTGSSWELGEVSSRKNGSADVACTAAGRIKPFSKSEDKNGLSRGPLGPQASLAHVEKSSIFIAINFAQVGFTKEEEENGPYYLLLVRNLTFLFLFLAGLEVPNTSFASARN